MISKRFTTLLGVMACVAFGAFVAFVFALPVSLAVGLAAGDPVLFDMDASRHPITDASGRPVHVDLGPIDLLWWSGPLLIGVLSGVCAWQGGRAWRRARGVAGVAALVIVLIANALFFRAIFEISSAAAARAFALVPHCYGVAAQALVLGVPLGVLSLWRGPRKWLGAIVLVLAVAPYITYRIVF